MVIEMAPRNAQVCDGGEVMSKAGNQLWDKTKHQLKVEMVQELLKGGEGEMVRVARKFRQLVSSDNHHNADAVVQAGCLSKFVDLLHCDEDWQLQNESAWVLCNVAGVGEDQSQAVVSAGALPGLVHLLASTKPDVRLSAAWAILNISGHDSASRDLVLALDTIPRLLPLLEETTILVQTAVWALRNLCRVRRSAPAFNKLVPCLPSLAALTSHSDAHVGSFACWALADLGLTYGSRLLSTLTPAFIQTLPQLQSQYPNRSAVKKLVEVVDNMEEASDTSTQFVSNGEQECNSAGDVSKVESNRHIPTKKRSRSPTLLGVSTRNTPKRLRVSEPTASCPSWQRTRGRARRPLISAPGHISPRLAHNKMQLWTAVATGDVERVAQLVKETGPNVTRGNSGCTLLHVAAVNNQPEVVEWLLQLLSPNLVNKAGLTPAHLAAMKSHTQVLRLLLDDPHLDHLARDPSGNTYHHWLVQPLFEAVLEDDTERIRSLLRVGADPDQDGGRMVGGALVRELRVTTARHLATTLNHHHILQLFDKTQSVEITSHNEADKAIAFGSFPLALCTRQVHTGAHGYEVYGGSGAYVTILSYASFLGQPHLNLPTSHTGAHNMASVFTKMGYSGHAHKDLTEQQTRKVLTQVRDMEELDRISCAIFVVSSHGTPHQHFLTSDGHLLDTRWLCDLFKDSQCPRLKNKPKLFIFDLCCGHYKQEGEEKKGCVQGTRVEEPLRDTVCLYSNSGELTWYSSSKDGTPFSSSLCRTLAQHGHQELGDLYRNFLNNYSSTVPTASPHLRNAGFTKRFYFTSVPNSS